jgi:DNA (cytosine-5)-methyltransferase 1
MKILNLFSGIGGNRKLWGDEHQITAVEFNQKIAEIYKYFFLNDKVIIADANEYLLNNFDRFDFIWSSPVCKTHSKMNYTIVATGQRRPRYIDLSLYQQIIFLKHWFKSIWVIENVIPYYKPLIPPSFTLGRHYYWSNGFILEPEFKDKRLEDVKANNGYFDLPRFKGVNKVELLKNCVDPEQGKYIFDSLTKDIIQFY